MFRQKTEWVDRLIGVFLISGVVFLTARHAAAADEIDLIPIKAIFDSLHEKKSEIAREERQRVRDVLNETRAAAKRVRKEVSDSLAAAKQVAKEQSRKIAEETKEATNVARAARE